MELEDGVQEQLEVSLEHSLTQRLGKYWKLWTEREKGRKIRATLIQ